MPKVTSSQTNLTAGEFSPRLVGRFDIDRYKNGANTLKNILIHNAGGGQGRPGTKFVGQAKFADKSIRLIEFIFNTEQTYIIEMGELYMRFYSNNGRVVEGGRPITGASKANPAVVTSVEHGYSTGDWVIISEVVGMTELNGKTFRIIVLTDDTFSLLDVDGNIINSSGFTTYDSEGISEKIVEIVTPYTESQLFDVQFAQTADLMYLAHGSHKPRNLSRTSSTSFVLSEMVFVGGPFKDDNSTTTTITPSGDTGAAITLTASTGIFNGNHVGSFWNIKDGYVKITAVANSTSATADVQLKQDQITAGDLNTGPGAVADWAEGAWSDDQGYPAVVSFHEQRLVFARTAGLLQTFWGSFIRVFTDFFPGTDASDAYTYEIASGTVDSIRWLSSGAKALQIGTFGGTFSASSGNTNEPITPSSIVVQRDTTYGTADIRPERIGNFVYYIQRNLTSLRELGFNFDIDAQQALDMTLLSDHILDSEGDVSGAKDIAYQQSPNNILWVVRNDGQLATLTRQIDQEVIGWSRQVIGGSFQSGDAIAESVAIIPGLSGDDQVWVVVKRTINSNEKRFIEFFMPQTFIDQDDAFFVDSGLSLDNPITITNASPADPVIITSAGHGLSDDDQIKIVNIIGMTDLNDKFYLVANKTVDTFELTDADGNDIDGSGFSDYVTGGEIRLMVTSITGLDHLEGETVQILADGAVRASQSVMSGGITLKTKAAKVHIGLGYNSDIELLALSDGSSTGTGIGKMRSIYEVILLLYRTLGIEIGFEDELNALEFRTDSVPEDQPPPLFTGTRQERMPEGWNEDSKFFIRQSKPLPMFIAAVVILSEVSDK